MPQEPGATIRIDGQLYQELRAIAEARDCTLRQAMDFWIDRTVKHGTKEPKPVEGRAEGGAKKRARSKAKRTGAKPKKPSEPTYTIEQLVKG